MIDLDEGSYSIDDTQEIEHSNYGSGHSFTILHKNVPWYISVYDQGADPVVRIFKGSWHFDGSTNHEYL